MNRVLVAFFALALVALGVAAPANTGTVQGRVLNASNGTYLPNAVVTIVGTNLQTTTDNGGFYLINDVPAGSVTVRASYTGMQPVTATANVVAGSVASADVMLNSGKAKVADDGSIVLDPYTVAADRFKNAQEIAINEERFSPNIKNVVATDSFGVIPSGNVGELVKFLPGVQVTYGSFQGAQSGYSENTASGVSVRGFGPEDTAILIDGMPVSNASPGSLTRQVGLDMLSINNASRVELIKVATPDMPNNAVGGQINLITRSAFEYAKPNYSYSVAFNFNSLDRTIGKTVGPVNKKTYKTTPSADFSVTYPISKTLGISVSGYGAREFDHTYREQPVWLYASAKSTVDNKTIVVDQSGNPISLTNPVMNRLQVTDIPRMVDQTSANVKVDWKPSPAQKLSANVQYSTYDSVEAQRRLDLRPWADNGAKWGPDYITGATGTKNNKSAVSMTITTLDKVGDTKTGQLQYSFKKDGWDISAAGSLSVSNGRYVDQENGHYSGMDLQMSPSQVSFSGIQNGVPANVTVVDKTTGLPIDYTQLQNWKVSNLIAQSGDAFSRNTVGLYKVDVARSLDFIRWLGSNSITVKTGFRRDQNKNEKWGIGSGFKQDLNTGTTFNALDVLDTSYVGQSPGFGMPIQQWASTYKLYELNKTANLFYTPTDGSDAVGNYNSWVNQQKSLTETKDGLYGMLEGHFIKNRLTIVAGLRQESNSRKGYGPFTDSKWNYAKNPDGTLYRDQFYQNGVTLDGSSVLYTDATGKVTTIKSFNFLSDSALLSRMQTAGVHYPDHLYGSTSSSVEAAQLRLQANHYINQKQTGKPSGSINAAFEVTKKLVVKAAWSRAFGLPALEDSTYGVLSGNGAFTMNENTTPAADGTMGTITVANPNIKPQVSDSWDGEVSYYTDKGGKLSISYYYKTVTNQIQSYTTYSSNPTFATIMTAIGLDPESYQDWKLTTSANSAGKQVNQGVEFEVRQDFSFLGAWGRHFQTFATYSVKKLGNPTAPVPYTVTAPDGTTTQITPAVKTITLTANHFAAAGLQFATDRFSAQVRGTYRNDNEEGAYRIDLGNGNYLRRIEPAETRIDIEAEYRFQKHYSVFISGRDVFNAERKVIIRDDMGQLPAYAMTYDLKRFGVTWTVGVHGTF